MNINCVICSDVLVAADTIFTTPCGHIFHHACLIQWMERSKSCPQCRNKCTERNLIRIYFNNLANLDSTQNTANLIQSIDDMTLKFREKEQALKAVNDEKAKLEEALKAKEKRIEKLDITISRNAQTIATYRHEIDIASSFRASYKAIETENMELKSKLDLMISIESVLTASQKEVDEVLKQNLNAQDLSVMVGTLRRELNSNEIRKHELRQQLKLIKNDLRSEQEDRRKLQDKLSFYESENHAMRNRLKRLFKSADGEAEDCSVVNSGIIETPESAKRPRLSLQPLGDLNTPSPLSQFEFQNRVAQVRESDSPYLNIKSSSIALTRVLKKPMQMKESVKANDFTTLKSKPKDFHKLSIFTKPRIASLVSAPSLKSENVVYNGIGGSTKVLPSDMKESDRLWPSMKPQSFKKKKLSPNALRK